MASEWALKLAEKLYELTFHDSGFNLKMAQALDAAAEEVVRETLNDHFDMGVTDKEVRQTLKRVLDKLGR